jgi:hypothetical protein
MRVRFVVVSGVVGVVLLAALSLAPICLASITWERSTVAFDGAHWTNRGSVRISYYGSVVLTLEDYSSIGSLQMRASGDVALPDEGYLVTQEDGVASATTPTGPAMGMWCFGERDIPLTPGDGVKDVTVSYSVRAYEGTTVVPGPSFARQFVLDTHRPTSVADGAVSCRKGDIATFDYGVTDELSPLLSVWLRITDARGRTVAKKALGLHPSGWLGSAEWRCRLQRGVYAYAILATDLAGNTVAVPGTARLTVR